jgi:hypothetical protein
VPALPNEKHERFAKHLAQGVSASKAYVASGYRKCRQNASRLSSKDDIKQRVTEIQETQPAPPEDSDRDPSTGRFLTGNNSSGGRPKGNRNRLTEIFLSDLRQQWEKSGAKALERVAQADPVAFCKITASILPKELDQTLNVNVGLFQECRDFAEAFRLARDHIGADAPGLLIEAGAQDYAPERVEAENDDPQRTKSAACHTNR